MASGVVLSEYLHGYYLSLGTVSDTYLTCILYAFDMHLVFILYAFSMQLYSNLHISMPNLNISRYIHTNCILSAH